MRQRCLTAVLMSLLPALALAQENPRPPAEEGAIVQTREGYKARTPRQVSHERNVYKLEGRGWKFRPGAQGARVMEHNPLPPDDGEWRRETACKADAIAIVTVASQRPVLSQGENFIFTEYRVEVNEAIKGKLTAGQRAVITRIGGKIDLPQDAMEYWVNSSPALVVGSKYLVFLRHLPETDDYTPIGVRTTYEVRPGGRLQTVHEGYSPLSRAESDEILSAARGHEPCGGR